MANLNLNKVVLAGRLTADPELKTTLNGLSVLSFSIAIGRRSKTVEGNYETDFIECTAWRQSAEFIAKHFAKGSSICVCGRLQSRKWTDKNGGTRYGMEVVVDDVMFVDSKAGATEPSAPAAQPLPRPETFEDVPDSDGLPF